MTERDQQRGSLKIALGVGLVMALALFFYLSGTSLASFRDDTQYRFDPRRVDLGRSHPEWLREAPLKVAFFASYLQVAGPTFSLLDEEAVAAFEKRLKTSPWIEAVQAVPVLPHSMNLDLTLRRPAAATVDRRGRLWLLAEDGMPLPLVRGAEVSRLERALAPLRLSGGPLALPDGEPTWDPSIRPLGFPLLFGGIPLDVRVPAGETGRSLPAAGAQIAGLVRNRVLPRLRHRWSQLPAFLGVDISNGGYRLLGARAEYRLVFLDALGRPVYLSWGHSPTTAYVEIPWQDKARNFGRLLEAWPGLRGIRWGDLRWSQSWQKQVAPRDGRVDEGGRVGGR